MKNTPQTKHSLFFRVVAVTVALLSGCADDESALRFNTGTESTFSLPPQLRQIAALDLESLTLALEVNSRTVAVPKTGSDPDVWSAIVDVPKNQNSVVYVKWSQTYYARGVPVDLTLAQLQRVVAVESEPRVVSFFADAYDTDIDRDGDGYSNLTEIVEGRSPVERVDSYIDIGGTYPTGIEQLASVECGQLMPIAIVTQSPGDNTAPLADEDLQAWWCANFKEAHTDDLGNLIPEGIEVIVNVIDDVWPVTDSTRRHDDDGIELFIDGNNSKGNNYDGVDDYQFIFRADGNNESPLLNGRAMPPRLTSSVAATHNGYKVTIYIPRQQVGIRNGQPFGINVEVNDDDDSGTRDNKLTWIGEQGVDLSWILPRAFGTSQIP